MIKSFKTKLREFLGMKSVVQLKRFLITGGISTIISYCVFSFSIRVLGIHYIIANLLSFCAGIAFGYNFNKRWSFGGDHQKPTHLPEYLAVYLSSLAIGTLILKVAVDYFGIIPEIAFLMSLCVTTCTNFLGIKFLVFKK